MLKSQFQEYEDLLQAKPCRPYQVQNPVKSVEVTWTCWGQWILIVHSRNCGIILDFSIARWPTIGFPRLLYYRKEESMESLTGAR